MSPAIQRIKRYLRGLIPDITSAAGPTTNNAETIRRTVSVFLLIWRIIRHHEIWPIVAIQHVVGSQRSVRTHTLQVDVCSVLLLLCETYRKDILPLVVVKDKGDDSLPKSLMQLATSHLLPAEAVHLRRKRSTAFRSDTPSLPADAIHPLRSDLLSA